MSNHSWAGVNLLLLGGSASFQNHCFPGHKLCHSHVNTALFLQATGLQQCQVSSGEPGHLETTIPTPGQVQQSSFSTDLSPAALAEAVESLWNGSWESPIGCPDFPSCSKGPGPSPVGCWGQ